MYTQEFINDAVFASEDDIKTYMHERGFESTQKKRVTQFARYAMKMIEDIGYNIRPESLDHRIVMQRRNAIFCGQYYCWWNTDNNNKKDLEKRL